MAPNRLLLWGDVRIFDILPHSLITYSPYHSVSTHSAPLAIKTTQNTSPLPVCLLLYSPRFSTGSWKPSPDGLTPKLAMQPTVEALAHWTGNRPMSSAFTSERLFGVRYGIVFTVMTDLCRPSTLIPFALVVRWCYRLTMWFSKAFSVIVLFMLGA